MIPDGCCSGSVTHLGLDVVERRRADEGEADKEDVGLGVRERAQSVIILLSSSIPKTQAHGLAIDHNTRRVVIESIAPRACQYLALRRGIHIADNECRMG